MNNYPKHIWPIGSQVYLNSGSPVLTVVDIDFDKATNTVAWKINNKEMELILPSVCFTRCLNHHII